MGGKFRESLKRTALSADVDCCFLSRHPCPTDLALFVFCCWTLSKASASLTFLVVESLTATTTTTIIIIDHSAIEYLVLPLV